jgi:hypothetical protein
VLCECVVCIQALSKKNCCSSSTQSQDYIKFEPVKNKIIISDQTNEKKSESIKLNISYKEWKYLLIYLYLLDQFCL